MIKDIKLGIAMMRNGLNYAGALGAILLIVVASLLCLIFVPVPMMSGVFIATGVLGIVQQVYTEQFLLWFSPHHIKRNCVR